MKRNLRITISAIFLIILLVALYYVYFSPKPAPQFSPPDESSLSFDSSKALLSSFPKEGIDWYCGKTDSYTDKQGNTYTNEELTELKKILGNQDLLEIEFC